MKGKIICIVIALMVLSVSAILVANPKILGEFSSTLNGVPVQVTISRQGNGTITTMQAEDLVENRADANRRFVRFIGIVESVTSSDTGSQLELDTYVANEKGLFRVHVSPLDAPHLPTEYQEGHVYEFTGFLTIDAGFGVTETILHVHAFEIRHHGESAAEQAARLLEGD